MAEKITNDDIIMSLLNQSFYKSAGATSLSDIAGVLSIKKASLYNHFDSRDDIISSAFQNCSQYMEQITFTPANVNEVAKKYSTETCLKGIVDRYFKMHEKDPLLQIYTFVESQKYFDTRAQDIVRNHKEKLIKQTSHLLEVLKTLDKINIAEDKIDTISLWFVSAVNDLLNQYLMEKKQLILTNPASGEGELFSLPEDQSIIIKVNALVDQFVTLIQ